MSFILETTDLDGDRLKVWQDGPHSRRVTVSVHGNDGESAGAYVDRAQIIAALGTVEPREVATPSTDPNVHRIATDSLGDSLEGWASGTDAVVLRAFGGHEDVRVIVPVAQIRTFLDEVAPQEAAPYAETVETVEDVCDCLDDLVDEDQIALLEEARGLLDPSGEGRVSADDLLKIAAFIRLN